MNGCRHTVPMMAGADSMPSIMMERAMLLPPMEMAREVCTIALVLVI